jgi:hypothetical protein
MAWQVTTQEGARPTGLGHDIISRLLPQPANPVHVHAYELALSLHEFACNKGGASASENA